MKKAAAIPIGSTGVYRLDCPTSPPRFEDAERLTVVKRGPVGHCIVVNAAGIEAIIRISEILLDEKWSMHPASLPGESRIDWAAMQDNICSGGGATRPKNRTPVDE